MTSTIAVNNDQHMNTPGSILIQYPAIMIEIPFLPPQYVVQQNVQCLYCGQKNQPHVIEKEEKKEDNDIIFIEEEKGDNDIIFIKEEKGDNDIIFIKEEKKGDSDVTFIQEEKHDNSDIYSDIKTDELFEEFDTDDRYFYQHDNIYTNNYSPISMFDTAETEKNNLSFYEYQDQFFDNLMGECFNDIDEVVQYLKRDISLV